MEKSKALRSCSQSAAQSGLNMWRRGNIGVISVSFLSRSDPTRRRFPTPVRIVLRLIGADDFMQLSTSQLPARSRLAHCRVADHVRVYTGFVPSETPARRSAIFAYLDQERRRPCPPCEQIVI